MHNGALACGYFGGKKTTPPPSFYFQLTAPGKKYQAWAERKIQSDLMELNATINRII